MGITAKENFRTFYTHNIPEWLPDYRKDRLGVGCTLNNYLESAHDPNNPDLPLREGRGQDGFGVWYVVEETSFSAPSPDTAHDPLIPDITEWEKYFKFPNLNDYNWEEMAAKDMARDDGTKFVNMSLGHGLYERLHFSMGMTNANLALMEEPEAVDDFFTAYFDFKIALLDKFAQYYKGVDMVEVSDDWGHKHGQFLSPRTWDEHIAPQVRRLVKHAKDNGFLYLQHSCGKNDILVPHMIDAGIDCWTSSQAINDLHGVVKNYGDKIIAAGGMDLEEFYEEGYPRDKMKAIVQARINDLCRGGAFLPYGTFGVTNLAEVVSEVVQENRDFFKNPENCKLPTD